MDICGSERFVVFADADRVPIRRCAPIEHVGQGGAVGKCAAADAGQALGDHDPGQAVEVGKGITADACRAAADHCRADRTAGLIIKTEGGTVHRSCPADRQLTGVIQGPGQTAAAAAGSKDDRISGLIPVVEHGGMERIVAAGNGKRIPLLSRSAVPDLLQPAVEEGVFPNRRSRTGDHRRPERLAPGESVGRDAVHPAELEI